MPGHPFGGMAESTESPGRFDGRLYGVRMLLPDGFPGQRLRVLPRPLVASALRRAPTSGLLVTDAGYFPSAANHGMHRPRSAPEAIVIVCTDGVGHCEVDGRVNVIRPGNALVLPPSLPHFYRADSRAPWTIWWLHAAGSQVSELLSVVTPDGGEAIIEVRDVYRAVSAIDDAIGFLERDETFPHLISASGAGWTLLAQLAADALTEAHQPTEPVRQAQEYLRHNFAKPVIVKELARTAGLSPSHFAALFRMAAGCGVVEYAKRLRMARARELLVTTSRDISEIARTIGYNDAFYFSRTFRREHGCSPSEYRRGKN
ncbi:AraC family transcriptional regulator [Amycolatopsis sp. WAC 01375]|nr:AraC family transcriptional regulator [Amycolatopsis sp. WAC 01375]RSN34656.1 AraC family transcriptional regulator [Amycolatopsis sp. WAC 01416]